MKPWVTLARDGALVLQERDGEYVIRSGGHELMSSRRHQSEVAMAKHAAGSRRVLIGGLGLGYTLRAVLDGVPEANVLVAELSKAVIAWNKGPLAHLHGDALRDKRVNIHPGDVATADGRFDSVLLDVDNGPSALSDATNSKLYGPAGLSRLAQMLKARGTLVVWSASVDPAFIKRMGRAGFDVEVEPVDRFVLFVGKKRR